MLKYFFIIIILFFCGCTVEDINNSDSQTIQVEHNEGKIKYSENITIYFTSPVSNPKMEQDLIEMINNQTITEPLDLCFYGFNRENVIAAIERAISRGVHVRFVGNKDGAYSVSSCKGDYYEGYNRIASALDLAFPLQDKKRINYHLILGGTSLFRSSINFSFIVFCEPFLL